MGSAVVRALAERGDRILNLDTRRKSPLPPALASLAGHPNYAQVEIDVRDRSLMRAVMHEFRPEAVIHLASISHGETEALFDVNIAGAFSVLEASRRHLDTRPDEERAKFRFVHAESMRPDRGDASSGASSIAAATMIATWSRSLGVPSIAAQVNDLYGPHQNAAALAPSIIAAAAANRPILLDAGGATSRDWLHVEDFAAGLIRCALAGAPGRAYAFTGGGERDDAGFASVLCTLVDRHLGRGPGEESEALIELTGEAADALEAPALDPRPAERGLKWRARSLHLGLRDTVEHVLTLADRPEGERALASAGD